MDDTSQVVQGNGYVTARELNLAVAFLSKQLDDGFTLTHQKQDYTNGRVTAAEKAISELKARAFAEDAVKEAIQLGRARLETWRVTALSTFGTSALGGITYLITRWLHH